MNTYGPTKSELKFRLIFSVAGLALLVTALIYRGLPQGPAMFEIVGIAGAFFGGTVFWTTKKLIKGEYADTP